MRSQHADATRLKARANGRAVTNTALIGSCALEDGARCEQKHWRAWPGQQWWRCSNESASVTFAD